jgi:hypothetical protein
MNKVKQRIAIAEAREWTDCEYIESLGLCKGKHENSRVQYDSGHSSLPDYLNDLNAMHDAEIDYIIPNGLWDDYVDWLKKIMRDGSRFWGQATAAQRAEAFLRTIGKWEE